MKYRRGVVAAAAAVFVATLSQPASASGWGATWLMDEPAGSTRMWDSSGNGHTGTLHTGVHAVGDGTYRFTGRGTVTVPDAPGLDPGSRDFRFEARVRMTGGYADPNLMQKGYFGTRGGQWKMDYWHGWGFCKFIGSEATRSVRVGYRLADGNWHTIICEKRAHWVSISVDPGTSHSKFNRLWGTVGSISNGAPVSIGGKSYCPSHRCDLFTGYMSFAGVRLL